MEGDSLLLDDRKLEPAGGRQAHSSSQAVAVGLVAGHVRGEVGLKDGWRRNGNCRRWSWQWKVRSIEPSRRPQASVKRGGHFRKNLGLLCPKTLASRRRFDENG